MGGGPRHTNSFLGHCTISGVRIQGKFHLQSNVPRVLNCSMYLKEKLHT